MLAEANLEKIPNSELYFATKWKIDLNGYQKATRSVIPSNIQIE